MSLGFNFVCKLCFLVFLLFAISSGGGGYLSTVRGTGTCNFLGVLFSNRYGIMGIIFTIF